jgi:hypothetical protein
MATIQVLSAWRTVRCSSLSSSQPSIATNPGGRCGAKIGHAIVLEKIGHAIALEKIGHAIVLERVSRCHDCWFEAGLRVIE